MARSPNRLSASEAVQRMADKRLKARDLVEACLDRIEAREGQVHAWEALDPEGARKRADMLDKRARPVGPLHGIPLAVKDIIDTRTMPTTCGSPIYRDHVAGKDAACVTQLVQGRRHRARQVGDHRVRRRPCRQDAQSAQSAPHAGRLVVGLRRRGRRFHGAGRLRHADRGLGDPARRLQRRGRLQGHLRLGRPDRREDLCAEPRHAGLLRARGQRPRLDPRRLRPRAGRSADAGAAHRLLPHAVVGPGRAATTEEHRGGGADLRAAGARVRDLGDAGELGRAAHGAEPDHDQGGDHPLRAGARALPASAVAQPDARRWRSATAVTPAQLADARKRKDRALADLAEVWERFDILLVPTAAARRRPASATPAIRSSTASGPCSARPASPCRSAPARSACRCRCSSSGRMRDDDQLIAWARWVEQRLS